MKKKNVKPPKKVPIKKTKRIQKIGEGDIPILKGRKSDDVHDLEDLASLDELEKLEKDEDDFEDDFGNSDEERS